MDGGQVLDVAREAIWVLLLISSPVMLIAMAIGVVIGLLQALTQIQEMTLVAVPKILAIFVSLLLLLPFMGAALSDFMQSLMQRVISP
ncbi:MAG: flagellar biosynthesis protein FliQ [Alphaproteobacteria bacterium]|nr:flagellar biosynthesis protein FliQ [Alphaproteobacteria bacterium]